MDIIEIRLPLIEGNIWQPPQVLKERVGGVRATCAQCLHNSRRCKYCPVNCGAA